ncbi:GNAT family N-acetyltransferase [Paenisporosarcina antarctica]|uniref:GNAT family N-acetyltransferase n=1 Tax=Paenisporosarcina antarctica TaxID=417367 RepID=UPI00141702F7|nr:GNAT family N-acetyltransferase [Paenisporosarcina antarctica]
MGKRRIKMSCKLESQQVYSSFQFKPITQHDITKVATTMLEAYEGTVDQQEETLEQAILEVEKIINNGYGAFISEASFWIEMNDESAAVICINLWSGTPLITEIYTGKKYLNQGMASLLIRSSMNTLYQMGYDVIELNVTVANVKAIDLYEKLGFVQK